MVVAKGSDEWCHASCGKLFIFFDPGCRDMQPCRRAVVLRLDSAILLCWQLDDGAEMDRTSFDIKL